MRRCCCRHRATDTDNAPEAAGRRGGRAAATLAVGVLHVVETRRASRGGRARRRRRPRPQPLQLPLPMQLSLPSCTTALARRQHASDGELLALHKSQARTEERRADVARGVSSRSAEERRRFASDSIISRRMYGVRGGRSYTPGGESIPGWCLTPLHTLHLGIKKAAIRGSPRRARTEGEETPGDAPPPAARRRLGSGSRS